MANTSKQSKPTKDDTEAHIAWFLKLSPNDFKQLAEQWNSQHLNFKLPKESKNWDYDKFFVWFSKQPATTIRKLQSTGEDFLSTEAYAALRRWVDIVKSPHRIEKIHSSALSRERDKGKKSLLEMAHDDDTIGVLEGMRDDMILESEKASPKDKPNYARAIKELMEEINDLKRKLAPSTNTKLGKLLNDNVKILPKQPSSTRRFKDRVMIEDVEK